MKLQEVGRLSLRGRRTLFALATFTLAGSLASVFAQGTAYLTGFVRDPAGAAVANASVTITSETTGTKYELQTTGDGVYRSPALTPGTYTVTVKAQGFQEAVTKGVDLLVGQPRAVDVNLVVGAVSQSIEVQASAPLMRTEEAGLGENVDYNQVSSLPYFNRSAGVLLSLAPTVRYTGEDVISYGASRYNVGAFTNVNVLVDGASVNGDRTDVAQMVFNPSVEALQEVKISTNQYSAEFGKDVGGLVQMEAKAGTNNYHGGVYYYFRNEALDAMNAFSRTTPVDRQHMFGGTVGGPVIKDKLFFFSSLEEQRNIAPVGVLLNVPTAAMKTGNFSQIPQQLYNPFTSRTDPATGQTVREPFPGNIIPSNLFDPSAVLALQYLPNPTQAGIAGNLPSSTGTRLTKYRGVERADWNISDNDHFFFDYMFDHTLNENLGVPAYNAITPAASPTLAGFGFQFFTQSYNFDELHTFSPSFFMTNRVAYRPRYIERVNPAVDPSAGWAEKLGIKNYAGARLPASEGGDLGFPSYNFSGYTGLGPGFLLFQEKPIKEVSWDLDFNYIHGKHSIRFGYQMEYGQHGAPDQSLPTGLFNFGPLETSLPGTANTGDAFASFLLGQVDSAQTTLGPALIWHNYYYGLYVQDDFKVNSKLTLNIGLRWDIDAPVYEDQNRGNGFDFGQINPVSGTPGVVTFLNTPLHPQAGFYNTDFKRFAPRFGFAWQVVPQTVIRGGYGIYNINPVLGANRRAPSLGFTTNATFNSPNGGNSPAFLLQNGFPNYPLGQDPTLLNSSFGAVPVGALPTTSPTFVNPAWAFGYVQNFNISVERQLPFNMLVEVAGQGSLGRRLSVDNLNWNEVPPQFWGLPGPNNALRPFPQFNNVVQTKDPIGTVNYYDGYVRLDKRFSQGLTVIANYSFGKSLGFLGGSIYYPRLSYGPTVFDEANGATAIPYQQALISWSYDLPWGPGRPFLKTGLASRILGGWSIGGVASLLGGVPFYVNSGHDSLNGNSPLGNRANLVGTPGVSNQTPDNWFNTAAFAVPAPGQIGNFGGTLLGPADHRLDLSLRKMTSITEKVKFTLVGEFFNFTNTPQFGPPDATLTDPTFGRTTGPGGGLGANTLGPYGGRQVQLGARVDF